MTLTTRYQNSLLLFLILLLLTSINTVSAHTSSNYKMSKDVLSNGGNQANSSNYQRLSTIGQPATRRIISNNTILQAGFHHPKQGISPATCKIYAVNDKGLNNSQFFTINLNDLTVTELGPLYEGHDIESLAIHPKTNMIYAASGDNVTNGNNGHFYIVDGQTGGLIPVGSTGFNEIEALTFSPDGGTLWAWAKGDGLITINPITGVGTLEMPSTVLIEGLTLSKETGRTVFYGSVNTALWVYDMDANTLDVACTNLFGETEALEMMPDGLLLVGTHNVPFGLHAFNPETCEVIMADETLTNQFNDVEGIALPVEACTD
ncbi:MAG: hypothetical protein DRR08_08485 [Candidatus Parabeggiatoa sp. nov. 2]|nr:MAG: hypothetical protein B6247_23065 [Beggiatoa sp. 4572_84]RKZ61541.1 MAG: hypothetical protein DRR08_08485 [Gammaproteobacteria bacterium]HEC83668.1 hypothetical protein [Thioploca sp.]